MRFAVYEMFVAPLALAFTALQARRALGGRRALVEVVALVAYGFAVEWTAIAVFASHRYAEGWRLAPLGIPVAVAAVWAALILSALALVGRLGLATPLARAAGAALLGIALDLLIEPVAVRGGLWAWTPPGQWLGVPVGNFVGWAVIVGAYAFGAERWEDAGRLPAHAARRITLGLAAVTALVAVGLAWRALGAEELFPVEAGWGVWAVLLGAAAAQRLRGGKPLAGATLAGRLAGEGTRLPEAVFLFLAATFTVDALVLGRGDLATAAAGTCLALFVSLPEGLPARLVDGWRRKSHAALAECQGLVHVLMKPRNGEAWTAADHALLHEQLRVLARWTPSLVLFLLPGGLAILPVYAWLLDRRRGEHRGGGGD